jgi:hypothetical protein
VPASVTEDGASSLVELLANWGRHTFRGTLETYGRLVCQTLDQLLVHVTVRPGRTWRHDEGVVAPACAGTTTMQGRLARSSGALLSSFTATLQIVAPS